MKNKSLNEMVLTLFTNQKDIWLNGGFIRHWLYQNSIGGLKITDIELRTIIKHLRFGGHPIVAGTKGYKYSTSKLELEEYIASRKLELENELNILRKMEGKW